MRRREKAAAAAEEEVEAGPKWSCKLGRAPPSVTSAHTLKRKHPLSLTLSGSGLRIRDASAKGSKRLLAEFGLGEVRGWRTVKGAFTFHVSEDGQREAFMLHTVRLPQPLPWPTEDLRCLELQPSFAG